VLGIEGGGESGEGEGDRGDGFRIRKRTEADCTFEKITKIVGSEVHNVYGFQGSQNSGD